MDTNLKVYPPMTSVTVNGNFGYITECTIASGVMPEYSVKWLIGYDRTAWWRHDELTVGENIMLSICDDMTHPFGNRPDNKKIFSEYLRNE